MPRLQHRQPGRQIRTSDRERLRYRPYAVIEPNVGVPQRIPQLFGNLCDHFVGQVVVQQHQIEIGVRHEFAAAQTTGGDDGEPARCRDADLGRLGTQPQLVEVQ